MDVLHLYRKTGAYLEGHLLLASGRHSPVFLQSTTLLQYPDHAERVGNALAELFMDTEADFTIGPAMGGVVLAFLVARALHVRALFAEKGGEGGGMTLREAFRITPGERFIAVEDVVTTGGSLQKAIHAAEREGGVCVGRGGIVDRGLSRFTDLRTLTRLEFPTYPPDACPLCARGLPLEDV